MAAAALGEVKSGNAKPILKLLGYSVVAGETETAMKNWLRNRERTDKNWAHRIFNDLMAAATFGYWGVAYEQAKFSRAEGPGTALPNILAPPALRGLDETYKALDDIAVRMWRGKSITPALEKASSRIAPGVAYIVGAAKRIIAPEAAEEQRKREAEIKRRRQKHEVLP